MTDSDREERSCPRNEGPARNEVPAQREDRSARGGAGAEGNELPGSRGKEEAIARIATAQSGSITNDQLTRAGLRHSGIGRRSDNGSLHRIYRGVYVVGHEALAPLARETAALLACGDGAVISHSSAAVLWRLVADGRAAADVHVTVIGRKCRSRPGLRAHRAAHLDPLDLRRINGLPVTSAACTLRDLAATGSPDLERAFGEAHVQGLLRAGELEMAVERWGPRAGIGAIRALMSDHASGFTRSGGERALRRLIRAARLPEPRFNVPFHRYELDALWQNHRLVVEVDGFGPHGHRAAFERDRRKDMALVAAGYDVIRVSWRQLNEEPLAVVGAIAAALGRGRHPG
jgi:very-short-patch-repair endonuclease